MRKKTHDAKGLSAATALAQVMSNNMGTLTIAVGQPQYAPDTATLYLPGIPTEDVPEDVLNMLRGYLAHEAAERRYTTWLKHPLYRATPGAGLLINGVNDVRIDRLQAKEWPGAGMNVEMLNRRSLDRFIEKGPTLTPDVLNVALVAKYLAKQYFTLDEAYALFPTLEPYLRRADAELRALTSDDEDAIVKQCVAIYEKIKNPPPPPEPLNDAPPPPKKSTGDEDEDAEATTNRPDNEEADASDSQPGTPDTDDAAGAPASERLDDAGDDADAGDASEDAAADTAAPLPDVAPGNLTDDQTTLNEIANAIMGGDVQHSRGNITTYTYDPRQDFVGFAPSGSTVAPRDTYAADAEALYTKLRRVLVTPMPRTLRYREKGDVDEASLYRLAIGETDVFERVHKVQGQDVAVSVSWDESSSMNGREIETVKSLAHSMNEALGRLGATTEFLGWTTSNSNTQSPLRVYRQGLLRHRIYKQFGERWNDTKVLRRLEEISVLDATPMGEGLLFAAERLLRRPEKRKLLFFLTDGEPSIWANGPDKVHYDFVKTLAANLPGHGIELVGIGIGVDIRALFPVAITVPSPDQIRHVVADHLVRLLKAGQTEERKVALSHVLAT